MSTVSVVIATRNRRQFLSEAIATVQEQTFADWELIVVDDASTDDTVSYLNTLRDARIRVITQAVHGERSAARNAGLADAGSEFIMFLDDDDVLRAKTLTSLVETLRAQPDAAAAAGACRILQANGDSIKVYHPAKACKRVIWRELLFGWWANSGQNLYRTALVREVGGFNQSLSSCEDRNLWLAVARSAPVCLVPVIAMEYRQHTGQSKPANLDDIRESVLNEFITTLPPAGQTEGRRIRRAAELVEKSEAARAARKFGSALRWQLQACWLAPRLLLSPLTGRPLWWGIKKCLLRVSAP